MLKQTFVIITMTASLLSEGFAADPLNSKAAARLAKEVRHELIMLPYYDVFDFLSFELGQDGKVTLMGSVATPTLKSSAENVVREIEGVTGVDNQIKVLPLSPNDNQLRKAVYRAIYGKTGLDRYGFQAIPSIHIVVSNGNVTLEGVVNSDGDRDLAGIQANSVAGVFSVKNNLRIEK